MVDLVSGYLQVSGADQVIGLITLQFAGSYQVQKSE